MPSAASAKLEKQASGNQTEPSTDNNLSPIRQILVIIDHKIRNLEKRKTKLESYRAIQSSGKELSSDQKAAVAKYDEVAHSLEFSRDLSKQIQQLSNTFEKEQKKQARREAALRAQAEVAKIREVLTILDVLSNFVDDKVREDLLNGTNGANKLEEEDLDILEKFYMDTQVKRQATSEDVVFSVSVQKAAEYLSLTVDGRPKQYGETTFENVRRILTSIQESGYLDKVNKTISETSEAAEGETAIDDEDNEEQDVVQETDDKQQQESLVQDNNDLRDVEDVDNSTSSVHEKQQQPPLQDQTAATLASYNVVQGTDVPKFSTEAPSAAAVPAPSFPQQGQSQPNLVSAVVAQPTQIQIPVVPAQIVTVSVGQPVAQPTANPLHAGHFPTTVRAVEQAYFKQHQYLQQMRPLAEVIGTTNFFFLQDSELDSPDLVPANFTVEGQGQAQNINAGSASNNSGGHSNQSNLAPQQTGQQTQQQQGQQMPAMPQTGNMHHHKSQKQTPLTNAAPIPSQTFTNQSFPPIVPPPSAAMFAPQTIQNPNDITSSQTQMPVFTGPLPIPQMVAQSVPPPSVVSGASSISSGPVLKGVESQQPVSIPNQPTLIAGPGGAGVPLTGYSNTVSSKYSHITTASIICINQQSNQNSQQDSYEKLQKSKVYNESQIHKKVAEIKEHLSNDNSNEWEQSDNIPKPQRISKNNEESNQWSNEVAASNVKTNEWSNSNYESQTESNNWNSATASQNDGNYRNRNNNYVSNNRSGGSRVIRGNGGSGGGGGPAASNGYRGGRSNNAYQQQQNTNRNSGMYFRSNNDGNGNNSGSSYYQSQNGGGGFSSTVAGPGKQQDTYGGSGINAGYRPRGGPMTPSNRQQGGGGSGNRSSGPLPGDRSGNGGTVPQRNSMPPTNRSNGGNMSANPNRTGGNPGRTTSNYGNSRPPPTIRQQQRDLNV